MTGCLATTSNVWYDDLVEWTMNEVREAAKKKLPGNRIVIGDLVRMEGQAEVYDVELVRPGRWHRCEICTDRFHGKVGARFCSSGCRSKAWRVKRGERA